MSFHVLADLEQGLWASGMDACVPCRTAQHDKGSGIEKELAASSIHWLCFLQCLPACCCCDHSSNTLERLCFISLNQHVAQMHILLLFESRSSWQVLTHCSSASCSESFLHTFYRIACCAARVASEAFVLNEDGQQARAYCIGF